MKKRDELVEAYSMDKKVTSSTPPTFMAHCTNDKTLVDNSLIYYKALLNSNTKADRLYILVTCHPRLGGVASPKEG